MNTEGEPVSAGFAAYAAKLFELAMDEADRLSPELGIQLIWDRYALTTKYLAPTDRVRLFEDIPMPDGATWQTALMMLLEIDQELSMRVSSSVHAEKLAAIGQIIEQLSPGWAQKFLQALLHYEDAQSVELQGSFATASSLFTRARDTLDIADLLIEHTYAAELGYWAHVRSERAQLLQLLHADEQHIPAQRRYVSFYGKSKHLLEGSMFAPMLRMHMLEIIALSCSGNVQLWNLAEYVAPDWLKDMYRRVMCRFEDYQGCGEWRQVDFPSYENTEDFPFEHPLVVAAHLMDAQFGPTAQIRKQACVDLMVQSHEHMGLQAHGMRAATFIAEAFRDADLVSITCQCTNNITTSPANIREPFTHEDRHCCQTAIQSEYIRVSS